VLLLVDVLVTTRTLVPNSFSYDTVLQTARSIPDELIFFLNLPNPSGRSRPWSLLSF
jgi:hypothetical protein